MACGSVGDTKQAGHVSPCSGFATRARIKPTQPPKDPFVTAVKYFALCLLAIGCFKVYPYVGNTLSRRCDSIHSFASGEFTLIHAVKLLDAEDPFFVRVGLSRLTRMIRTENGARRVVEASAVPKCLKLLNSETDQSDPSHA